VTAVAPRQRNVARKWQPPKALDRRFEAIVFDWDGTAVPDRAADASVLRGLTEDLCAAGMHLAVITGTHVGNVDRQLGARPSGPGRLLLCVNRGSEVYEAQVDGLHILHRREATAEEDAALDATAAATATELERRGVHAVVVSDRLNRRKIDLIPEPEWADPPKARIQELLEAVQTRIHEAGIGGLSDVVEIALAAAHVAGVGDARVTSDAKHVEIGLTDKADSARWVFGELERLGVGHGLVLIAGDEFGSLGGLAGSDSFLLVPDAARATAISVGAEPTGTPPGVLDIGGGPETFEAILRDQLERRRCGDVPEIDGDPNWTIQVSGLDPKLERVHESLLTLADGRLGTRGNPLVGNGTTAPRVFLAGAFVGSGATTELAAAPVWTTLPNARTLRPRSRTLDLRTGVLREEGPATALRFSSLARPGTVVLRVHAKPELLPRGGRRVVGRNVRAAIADHRRGTILDRFGAFDCDGSVARSALAEAEAAGFDRLLAEQREAWAARWRAADVVIEGDHELQRAVRFALFHLMGSVASSGEAAVGARGLSGSAYRGHVFWDSDVFVLPFLAATNPAAARAMLEYRVRRLPQARDAARRLGRAGARFAWESAADGVDVTPPAARRATGELVRIRTGELEEHIVADVAWAAATYVDWTRDEAFAAGPGRELLMETARYWASRVRRDRGGRAHIYGVIGPDEYHEPVDDNAFTNVIARWNLRRAAAIDGVDESERRTWRAIADALVDGYDRASGLYEQFAGFFDLEPLVIADLAPRRPVAADLLLGAERTRAAQVLKQADALMLHHLVPDEVAPGSLVPNLEYYEPRTAHGSSLSPAIHASLLARAGRYRPALEALELASRIDLDDLTETTAGGLHLATMGGTWQALAFGFAGLRANGSRVAVDPRLPPEWNALELGLRFGGEPFRLRIEHESVEIDSDAFELRRSDNAWEVRPR
jgi:trehalose/maltose hydrolase-like predicted phosphorylase